LVLLVVEHGMHVPGRRARAVVGESDTYRERQAFEDDRVVRLRLRLALDPHGQLVGHPLGGDGRGSTPLECLAHRRHPRDLTRVVESCRTARQRGSGSEEPVHVDLPDDELVETGDDADAEAGARVERRDPTEQFLHASPVRPAVT